MAHFVKRSSEKVKQILIYPRWMSYKFIISLLNLSYDYYHNRNHVGYQELAVGIRSETNINSHRLQGAGIKLPKCLSDFMRFSQIRNNFIEFVMKCSSKFDRIFQTFVEVVLILMETYYFMHSYKTCQIPNESLFHQRSFQHVEVQNPKDV